MALPKYKSFLGIAKETAHAAGVAPTAAAAVDFLPINSLSPFDNIKYLDDENWRGSMVKTYDTTQGPISSEFEFSGTVYPDTIGYPIAGVLGDVVKSGASAPYTYAISTLNSGSGQTTSYTITDYNAVNARQFAGCQFGSADFKFNADGLLEYTATAQGFKSATATVPTASYSTVTQMPVWEGSTSIAGSAATNLSEGNITIKRELSPIFTVNNSQSPYQIFQGAVEVEGSLTLVMEDDTQLQYYLSNTQPSLSIDFTQGAGATLTQIKFFMTKCAFTVAKVTRSKDYVELMATFKAIANTTDAGASGGYSPIKVTLQNAKATNIYS
jgi:hypothetical protein